MNSYFLAMMKILSRVEMKIVEDIFPCLILNTVEILFRAQKLRASKNSQLGGANQSKNVRSQVRSAVSQNHFRGKLAKSKFGFLI